MSLPSGTLTFLFTDVEGSTRLWERDAEGMRAALALHDRILTQACEKHGGAVFKKMGDAVYAVFTEAGAAVAAALDGQAQLQKKGKLPVRMALYTGYAQVSQSDYVGPTLNRTARILATGHGGQVLLCQATRDLAQDSLPAGAGLLDLGSHGLKDLERAERVYQLTHASIPADFPPLRSLSTFKHNLPIQLTRLIGREREIREVEDLLTRHRLVTLYGSGGCGKTRLALQVAAESIDQFPDGVWLIELGSAVDSVQAEQALAAALGVREEAQRDMGQAIMQHLRERRALLILDNCEHLVESCAKQAIALLQGCSEVRLLVTSREVLSVPGEVTWRVPSLAVPGTVWKDAAESDLMGIDSVRLFVERASEAAPEFRLRPDNIEPLSRIVRRLDGIPLALELAAARVKSLSVEQIAERLQEHFSILVGPRTALPRHKTLQATMDWSYLLLDPVERALLARLTVFSGGWTLDSTEAICATRQPTEGEPFTADQVLELLSRLEDKSLIGVARHDSSRRYQMLQMVREYAAEHLSADEVDALGRRHLQFFLGVAQESAVNIPGPNQAEWLRTLDTEHDNLRAALEFAKRNRDLGESGLQLAGALSRYWHIRGFFSEGRRHLSAMLGLAGKRAETPGLASAMNGLGILAWSQGDLKVARDSYESSLDLWQRLGDEYQAAWVLSNLGLVSMDERKYPEAREQFETSLEIRRREGDRPGEALSLMNLGILARYEERFSDAQALYAESLSLFRELDDLGGEAKVLNNLVDVLFQQGDTDRAVQMQEESLHLFERLGDRRGIAFAMRNLGDVWAARKDVEKALHYFASAVLLSREIGIGYLLTRALQGIAREELNRTQPEVSATVLGAAKTAGNLLPAAQSAECERERRELEGEAQRILGARQFHLEYVKGAAMTSSEIDEFVRAHEV